jgi:hypothetical protein
MTYIISSEVSHLGGNNLDWRGLIERLSAFISTVCENEEKKPNPTRNKSSTHDTHKEKYYLRWFSGFNNSTGAWAKGSSIFRLYRPIISGDFKSRFLYQLIALVRFNFKFSSFID